jgi:hypothetical protein
MDDARRRVERLELDLKAFDLGSNGSSIRGFG